MMPHILKSLATVCETAIQLGVTDPAGFLLKVGKKARLTGFRGLSETGNFLENYFSRGYSEKERQLAWNVDSPTHTGAARKFDVKFWPRFSETDPRFDLLRFEIEESPRSGGEGMEAAWKGELPRVLYHLNSSFPHTLSGYTVRTHRLLTALRQSGLIACQRGITRFGYPASIGSITNHPQDDVDGIQYSQNLSFGLGLTTTARVSRAVDGVVASALEMQATVLHATTDYTNAIVVSRAAKHLGIPWIYEVRGEPENTWLTRFPDQTKDRAKQSDYYRLSRRQETVAAKRAAQVIVLSEVSKADFVSRGIPPEKITVVPNAIEAELLDKEIGDRSELRKKFGLPTDVSLIGSVTAVVGYEGLDTAVRILPKLESDTHLLVVGDGDELPRLKSQAEELGVNHRTHFVGKQDQQDIEDWYQVLDVFIVPRRDEEVCRTVTPIKATTAQALGIPVVASDLPALREVTGSRERYVRPGDVQEWARVLKDTLASLEDRNESRLKNDSWLRSRTWSANARKLSEIYRSL